MTTKKRRPPTGAAPKKAEEPSAGSKDLVEAVDGLLQKDALPKAAVIS